MIHLSTLLARHVRPRPDDALHGLLLRADAGARIVGALAVAAVSGRPGREGLARTLHALLARGPTGHWLYATRASLTALPDGPASGWAHLLCGREGAPARSIDGWLTPYEISLRHSGRRPPVEIERSVEAELRRALDVLCDRVLSVEDPSVEGEEEDTRAWDLPCAPYLEVHHDDLWLWEHEGRRTAVWRVLPEQRRSEAPSARGRVGLRLQDTGDLVDLLVGAGDAELPWSPGTPAVLVLPSDVVPEAERLAARWRRPNRAVVVTGVGPGDPLAAVLEDTCGPGGWAGLLERARGRAQVLFVLAGELDPWEFMRLAAASGDGAAWLSVVTDAAFDAWPPEVRRDVHRVPSPAPGDPEVVTRLDAHPPAVRWRLAAEDIFELSGPADIRHLRRVLAGAVDLLAAEGARARTWWARGLLELDAAGRPRPRHPGWRALAAGLLDQPAAGGPLAAWEAGRALSEMTRAGD